MKPGVWLIIRYPDGRLSGIMDVTYRTSEDVAEICGIITEFQNRTVSIKRIGGKND
jgi:hypothetical protein